MIKHLFAQLDCCFEYSLFGHSFVLCRGETLAKLLYGYHFSVGYRLW